MSDKNYITFIDNAGRSIFGSTSAETESTLKVQDPVMIIVQQQENGQMSVQLFPLFFPEFVSVPEGEERHCQFTYNKANIALGSDFNIDPRIIEQYEKIVNPTLVPTTGDIQNKEGEPEVIKLFDEE